MRPIRTILLAAAAAAALMLSACSSTPPAQPSETEGSPSALAGSIEVWVMGNKGPLMEQLSADFTRQTGVTVEIQAVPWGEVRAKMSTAIVSGEGPDVLQVGLDRMAEWSEAGGLLELSDIISQHPSLAVDNFLPASASTMDYAGEIFTVPWLSDTRTLFYRTDLLAAAGFDAAPATWDDWLAAAKVLTERGGRNYGMGFNLADVTTPLILTWSQGGEIVSGGKLDFASPAFTQALEFQHQFYASGYTPARALPDDEVVAGFKDGTIPMFISGPYMTRSLADQAPELDGQWAIARIPAKASSTSLMAGSNIGIFAQSDNVAAAGAFLAFLAEAETQLRWNSLSNDLPAVADAMEELAASDPMAAVFFEQMQDAKPVPIISTWGQVSQEVLAANEQINVGGASVDEAVASLQQRVAGL